MKSLTAFVISAAVSLAANATPAIKLPTGPLYLKFSGQEQIAINKASTWTDGKEINWGVFIMSTIEKGDVDIPNDEIDPNGDIFFVNGAQKSQITGMFYGIERGTPSATNPFPATKGYMDLYWRDLSVMSKTSLASTANGIRCGYSCAKGYTEGTFLARLMFDTGMDTGNALNTIVGSKVPSSKGFSGVADSYASVDMRKQGLWSKQLDSDYFHTNLGMRDLRFKNSYNYNAKWNGKTDVLGARLDDPGQAYVLPEPGALSLFGLAGLGLIAVRRRSRATGSKAGR